MPVQGPHRPQGFDEGDQSHIPIRREEGTVKFNTKDVPRATDMESFLVWDSSQKSSTIYELGAFPCLSAASIDSHFERVMQGKTKHIRGKWESLLRCGAVFAASPSLKFILSDGHGSHRWVHELLLGQQVSLPDELLQRAPFFNELETRELPMVAFPLPWRNVLIDGVTIHYIPGKVGA